MTIHRNATAFRSTEGLFVACVENMKVHSLL